MKTISLEEYYELELDWVHDATEQYVDSGLEVTFRIETDGDLYYCTCFLTDEERDREFCKENGYDTDYLEMTKSRCANFQCRVSVRPDAFNNYIKYYLTNGKELIYEEE